MMHLYCARSLTLQVVSRVLLDEEENSLIHVVTRIVDCACDGVDTDTQSVDEEDEDSHCDERASSSCTWSPHLFSLSTVTDTDAASHVSLILKELLLLEFEFAMRCALDHDAWNFEKQRLAALRYIAYTMYILFAIFSTSQSKIVHAEGLQMMLNALKPVALEVSWIEMGLNPELHEWHHAFERIMRVLEHEGMDTNALFKPKSY
jgi:hypothetical protein